MATTSPIVSAVTWLRTRVLPRVLALLRVHWAIVLVMLVLMGTEYTGQRWTQFIQTYQNGVVQKGSYSPLAVRGIPWAMQDETSYWAIGVRLAQGLWSSYRVPDVEIFEHRDSPTVLPALTFNTLAMFIKLIGDPEMSFRVARVLFAGLVRLSIYLVVRWATGGILIALVASVLTMTAAPLFLSILPLRPPGMDIVGFAEAVANPASGINQFYRIPYVAWAFPWLMATVAAVGWALRKQTRWAVMAGGVAVGTQPLVYPYFASSWAIGLPLLTLWFAACRDWERVKTMILLGVVAAVAAVPALIQHWELRSLSQFSEIMFSYTRTVGTANFDWYGVTYLVTIILLWVAATKLSGDWQMTLLAVLSCMAGAALLLNHQLISGAEMLNYHWKLRVLQPLMVLSATVVAGMAARFVVIRWQKATSWRVAGPALAAVLVSYSVGGAVQWRMETAKSQAALSYIPYDHKAGYRWLRENTDRETVVMALSSDHQRLLQPLGGVYTYIPSAGWTVTPYQERVSRWVAACRYYGMSTAGFDTLIGGPGTRVLYNR